MVSYFGGQGNTAVYCAGGCGKKTTRKVNEADIAAGYRPGTPLCRACSDGA